MKNTLLKLEVTATLLVAACAFFWISTRDSKHSASKTIVDMPLVEAIAIDETYVYWSTRGLLTDDDFWNDDVAEGKIMRAKKDGSNIETLASSLYTPWDIAVDEKYVYWVSVGGSFRVCKCGGEVELIEGIYYDDHYGLNGMNSGDIEVDNENVYWVNYDDGYLNVMNKETKVVTDIDLGNINWDIELQGGYIYGIDGTDNKTFLWRINKDGTGLTRKYLQDGPVSSFSVDDLNVYWGVQICYSENSGNVMKMPLSEQTPSVLTRNWDCNSGPVDLISDTDYLYWNTNFGTLTQNLVSLPKQGGAPVVLARKGFIHDMVVDIDGLFFTRWNEIMFVANDSK